MTASRNTVTAKDPEAYVAQFNADAYWAGDNGEGRRRGTMRLVEVLPGLTKSGRRRFVIETVLDRPGIDDR